MTLSCRKTLAKQTSRSFDFFFFSLWLNNNIFTCCIYVGKRGRLFCWNVRHTRDERRTCICDPICRNWIQLLNTRFTPRAKDIVCKMTMPPVVGGARLCIHTIKTVLLYRLSRQKDGSKHTPRGEYQVAVNYLYAAVMTMRFRVLMQTRFSSANIPFN
jgi:hypothetical protein